MNKLTVSWFSAGVSSAVATKLMIDKIDRIIYTHIDDQHPDTMRFVKECEAWFGKPVEILQSPYKNVENALKASCFINSASGASCSRLLKRRLRKEWEIEYEENTLFNGGLPLQYVWGMDCNETDRCERLRESMPNQTHVFPLVDRCIDKEKAHQILKASGIKRPQMYDMGYRNNNCIGCVKGGMWYWNKIRKDFPDVFNARCRMERLIGSTCLKKKWNKDEPISETNTAKFYLDELEQGRGREEDEVNEDCGIMCELIKI